MSGYDLTDAEQIEQLHRDLVQQKSRCDTWARKHAPSGDAAHPLNRYLSGAEGFASASMKYAAMLHVEIAEAAKPKLPECISNLVREFVK